MTHPLSVLSWLNGGRAWRSSTESDDQILVVLSPIRSMGFVHCEIHSYFLFGAVDVSVFTKSVHSELMFHS